MSLASIKSLPLKYDVQSQEKVCMLAFWWFFDKQHNFTKNEQIIKTQNIIFINSCCTKEMSMVPTCSWIFDYSGAFRLIHGYWYVKHGFQIQQGTWKMWVLLSLYRLQYTHHKIRVAWWWGSVRANRPSWSWLERKDTCWFGSALQRHYWWNIVNKLQVEAFLRLGMLRKTITLR